MGSLQYTSKLVSLRKCIIFTMFIKIPKLLVVILISATSARHLNLQQENSTDEGFEELVEEVMNVILTDDENFNTTSSKILGTIGTTITTTTIISQTSTTTTPTTTITPTTTPTTK